MALSNTVRARLQQAFGITQDERDAAAEMCDAVDAGSNGSGLLVLEDGAELNGTYNSNILVNGSCTVTGDVLVNGFLYVTNSITNDQGHEFTVRGDLTVENSIQFDPATPDIEQSNMEVHGDLHFGYMTFSVNPGFNPSLYVWGDLISINGDLDAGGNEGANGLSIYVNGDLLVSYININGGEATAELPGGNAGEIGVSGDCTFYDGLDAEGGYTEHSGQNAGGGGSVYVNGSLVLWGDLSGGSVGGGGANASAGGGGFIQVDGDATLYWVSLEGGDCDSSEGNNSAGVGGDLECWASIDGDGWISCSAGSRTGSLGNAGDTYSNITGGSIQAYGDMLVAHAEANGCNDSSSDGEGGCASGGGSAGSVQVWGDLIAYQVQLIGGSAIGKEGGNGGYLRVKGRAHCTYQINNSGGSSDTFNGSANRIDVFSGLMANYVTMLDGDGGGTAGGNEINLNLTGSCNITNLSMTDKSTSYIRSSGFGSGNVTLTIGSMSGKSTLNQPNGDQTIAINEDVEGALYLYNLGSGWYSVAGVSIATGG